MEETNSLLFSNRKKLALLIDPDKHTSRSIEQTIAHASLVPVSLILVGGSMLFASINNTVERIKQLTSIPVWLFPGSSLQITPKADGILFLSLISGRNPELLIGNHVIAAPLLRRSKLQVVPVGYILVEGGAFTSVEYMSQTKPIPRNKTDIAVATAMAGEMLGLKMIYLEAGSGAKQAVPPTMITAVKKAINLPVIVGGGLSTQEGINRTFDAGADWIVIGNAAEENSRLLKEIYAGKG